MWEKVRYVRARLGAVLAIAGIWEKDDGGLGLRQAAGAEKVNGIMG